MKKNNLMKNIKSRIKFTFLVLIGGVSTLNAQTETTLTFMDNLYQSTYYSPFNKSEFKVSIGLPGISSMYLNAINSGFSASDLAPNGFSKPLDPMAVVNKMRKKEFVSLNTQVDLFHVFLQKGSDGLSFNITENLNTKVSYPSDIIKLAWEGNGAYIGEQIDLSGFGVSMQHYREYAFGYYKTLEKWQFGGKAKLLFGKYAVNTKSSDLTIDVSDDVYQINAKGNFELNTGGYNTDVLSEDSSGKEVQNYLLNKNNKGFALDLGASFKYSDKLQFNASVTNLGYIKWKDNTKNYTYNSSIAYDGIDFFKVLYENDIDSLSEGFDKYFKEFVPDSSALDTNNNSFRTSIPVNFALGARYDIWKKTYAVGRVNFSAFHGLRTAVTVGVYHDLYRWFNIGLTNTSQLGKLFNPGVGLVLKGGPIQFYVVTDNFLLLLSFAISLKISSFNTKPVNLSGSSL